MDDAIKLLVYRELERHLSTYNGVNVWLSHNYDPSVWEPRFAEQQRKIDEIRKWAEQLPDEQKVVRKHYLDWLKNYYQSGLDDARSELQTQSQKREMEQSRADSERLHREASALAPIPKPTFLSGGTP